MSKKLEFQIVFDKLAETIREQGIQHNQVNIVEISEEVKILRQIVEDLSTQQEPVTYTRS